jgi:hypothetical protein
MRTTRFWTEMWLYVGVEVFAKMNQYQVSTKDSFGLTLELLLARGVLRNQAICNSVHSMYESEGVS